MRHSPLAMLVAVAVVAAAPAQPALGAPGHHAAAKRCYAKKHGKRVQVKCPAKKPARPKPQPPAAPPGPQNDPALAAQWNALLAGEMLHRFSNSASHTELLLHMCAGSAYQYIDFADTTGTASNNGLWRVTGAENAPQGILLGLLLAPANGSPARFFVLQLTPNSDGTYTVLVNGDQWYLSTSTLCPPA